MLATDFILLSISTSRLIISIKTFEKKGTRVLLLSTFPLIPHVLSFGVFYVFVVMTASKNSSWSTQGAASGVGALRKTG